MQRNRTSRHSQDADVPATVDMVSDEFIERLLGLRVGDSIRLELEEARGILPEFHDPDYAYDVTRTKIKKTTNGQESFFQIYLSCPMVGTVEDPVFQLTVSRRVPSKPNRTRKDAEWSSFWIQHFVKTRYDKPNWHGQSQYVLVDFEYISGTHVCPECGLLPTAEDAAHLAVADGGDDATK